MHACDIHQLIHQNVFYTISQNITPVIISSYTVVQDLALKNHKNLRPQSFATIASAVIWSCDIATLQLFKDFYISEVMCCLQAKLYKCRCYNRLVHLLGKDYFMLRKILRGFITAHSPY